MGKKIYTRPESQSTSPMYLGAHYLVLKFEPMVWSPVKNKIKETHLQCCLQIKLVTTSFKTMVSELKKVLS